MKLNRVRGVGVLLTATVVALSIGSAFGGDGKVLTVGDGATMDHWYGRAGGLVGSDRIDAIVRATSSGGRIGVTYDRDVAARTNMHREDAENGNVSITYDKDVADRTNMPRGEKSESIKAVGVPAKPAN